MIKVNGKVIFDAADEKSLSDEEIRQIPELSRARLTILLAEGYQHE